MKPAQILGWKLRTKRTQNGISLKAMAKMVGISPSHLQFYENGERIPSEEVMIRISKAYQWDEDDLRAKWGRPKGVIIETATKSGEFHKQISEFFNIVKDFDDGKWIELVDMARSL